MNRFGLVVSLFVASACSPIGVATDAGAAGGAASAGGVSGGGTSGGGTSGGGASGGGASGGGASGGGASGGGASGGGASAGGNVGGGSFVPDGGIDAFVVTFERATPEQVGLHAQITRTVAASAKVKVRYRRLGETAFVDALPLLRIHPEWTAAGAPRAPVDAFAGTIFDLTPGTTYELELTLEEQGSAPQSMIVVGSTRALPPASGPATVTAAPADNLQQKLNALNPGDVLELANGTYAVNQLALTRSGTAMAPITIRGASRAGVILRDTSGIVLQLQAASHVVIEDLTLEGAGTDSGTNASSVGISFWNGALQEFVTLRRLDVRGVDMGVVASGTIRSVLVYDCALRGNNVWTMPFIQTNLTWNDDGLRLPGEGNCGFDNTLHGFGDSFAVTNGVFSAAVHFYRNRVTMTGDDGFEADYGTRNLGFYDNVITNSATFLSLDPLWGGPLYAFRNVSVNALRGPFKLNAENSGFLVFNNTVVRTEGTTTWGWVQFNNGPLRNWSFRNNLLVYRGPGNLLAIESPNCDPIDFTHNAWFPNRSVWWSNSGGSFTTLAAARAALPATTPVFGTSTQRHTGDVLTVSDPFVTPVTLGADHLTEVTSFTWPALKAGDAAKNAGVAIPNVTDGFNGAAPDIGAVIEGRPTPMVGARRP